ncbi:MAG: hypothetical protein ACM3JI_01300 [Anaerolineae bacterium]
MSLQETLGNCCRTVQDYVAQAGNWVKDTATSVGNKISDATTKVVDFASPYFKEAKAFVTENPDYVLVVTGAFALGAAVTAFVNSFFCKDAPQEEQKKAKKFDAIKA